MDMEPTTAEHEWLQQLVGEWTYENECVMGPGQPPMKFSGTETVRSLGPYWILLEGHGDMPGGGIANMLITIGYEPAKQKYVGTFVASMMSKLWIYEGTREGNKLSLYADGPSFSDPTKTTKYIDATELISKDERIFTSSILGDDGKWITFMTATYKRKL